MLTFSHVVQLYCTRIIQYNVNLNACECTVSTFSNGSGPEAGFLDEILKKVFPLAILSHLYSFALRFIFIQLTQPLPVSTVQLLYTVKRKEKNLLKKNHPFPYGLKKPYRNLTSEYSQDYAQKPQRNFTSMNSASEVQCMCMCLSCTSCILTVRFSFIFSTVSPHTITTLFVSEEETYTAVI